MLLALSESCCLLLVASYCLVIGSLVTQVGCARNFTSTSQRPQVPNPHRHSQDHQRHHFTVPQFLDELSNADGTHSVKNDHSVADSNLRQPGNSTSASDRQTLENSRGVGEVLLEEKEEEEVKQEAIACLRRVPAAELVRAQAEVVPEAQRHMLLFPFAPLLDGRVLRPEDDPLHVGASVSAAAAREQVRTLVPLLVGLYAAEMGTLLLYELARFFGHELRGHPRQLTYAHVGG